MESINQSISDKIRTTGSFILNNSDKVDNEYLTSLAKQFEIDEINYTDTNGKNIYSNLPTSIGSDFDSNHISYPVLKGDKNFFVENIRKSKETNDYYKYGYVSKSGIGMVQIGIIANKVQSLSKSIETQTLVEKLTEDKSIMFAVFIDTNLAQIANSDTDEIGVKVDDIGSKTAAVEGKPYSSTYQYKGIEVYDVLVPVHDGDKLLGAIDIGLSMKTVKDTINNVLVIIIGISLIIFIISAFILLKVSKGITNPLNKLVFAAGKIAQGDLRDSVEINSNDEIGILYNSFDTMTKYLKDTMKTIKDNSNNVTNLVDKQSITVKSTRDAFNEMLNSLSNIGPYVADTNKSLQTTMNSKNTIIETMDNVTAVSQETSASAEEIAASSEEMLANSEEVSDFAMKLEEISKKLNDEINKFEI